MEKSKRENLFRRALRTATGLTEGRKAFALPYLAFMLLFVVLPLVLVVVYAFITTDASGAPKISFENFAKIFRGDIAFFSVLWRSLYVGVLNSVLCLIIGYPIAYFLSQRKYNKSPTLYMLFVLPIWMNFLLRTLATKAIFNSLSIELGGMTPVMFGMVYNFLPFMILPLYNVLSKMDKNLIEAAADLGANNRQVFMRAIVPLSMPGIVSGVTMVFMPTISTFVITDFLSNNNIKLLGNLIDFWASQGSFYVACTLSLIMLVIVGLTMIVSNKFDKLGEGAGEGLW